MAAQVVCYQILDLHPRDSYYCERDRFKGKLLISQDLNPSFVEGYFCGSGYVEGRLTSFAAVKLEPQYVTNRI